MPLIGVAADLVTLDIRKGLRSMEFKEKLGEFVQLSTRKHVGKHFVFLLAAVGLLTIVVAIWLTFSDWRYFGVASEADEEGRYAISSLMPPVQALKNAMADEQAQALAIRALEDPDAGVELTTWMQGKTGDATNVSVFGTNLDTLNPAEFGPNGYAVYDMILSTLENGKGQMQVHFSLQPPRLFDSAVILSEEMVVGVMVVELDLDYLLTGFNPEYSSLGYISLTQYNGRQRVSHLREWGDPSIQEEIPDRIPVPGTLFRVEYPQPTHIGLISSWTALMAILAGVLCIVASLLLYRARGAWKKEYEARKRAIEIRIAKTRAEKALQAPEPVAADVTAAPTPAIARLPADVSGEQEGQEKQVEPDKPPVSPDASDLPPMRLQYNLKEKHKLKEATHSPVELTPEIFRAYDIRGVIDKTLDSGVARGVGQAVGTLALQDNVGPVVVARDGRLSGPYLMEGMIEGILASGCDVLDIGAVPTGVLYYAAHEMGAGSGVMITGSHNPPDYNGFKIMIGGDTLYGEAISDLYRRIMASDLSAGEGTLTRKNVVPDYIQRIADDIQVERELKVVIDCGNGIGGVCAAEVLRAIGVEVLPLFDEVDGTFPNHHPDPSDPENLSDLIESVRLMDADLGLALDGDADRLGVVTLGGDIIFPDRIMMLLALDVLDRKPGATIIYDVKCTSHLPKVIEQAGGNPVMYKTGHSLIKAKMKEIGSPFAGEMSGHFFFGERWYGVDDGIYAAARLLEILGSTEAPPEAILNALPTSFSTPELKVHLQEGENHAFVEAFIDRSQFQGASISTIDGLRADFDDGWGLVRASNTTPILVVRFDAETEEALERIKDTFRSQMLELKPDLELPF
jgi:phosphomannomutase/phosphoglucomutase